MFLRSREGEETQRAFTRRALLLGGAQAVGFGLLGARLYQLQVMEGGLYAPLADRNRLSEYALAPLRGRILDSKGRVLADTVESFRCYITPSLAGDIDRVLDALSGIVPIDQQRRQQVLARVRRQPANLPIIVADGLTWQQAAKASVHTPVLPGVEVEIAGRRIYNGGREMGHIIGYVGPVERFALDDRPEWRVPGMRVGKTGVERGMDDVLRGRGGLVRREVDSRGHVVRQMSRVEPVAGRDVTLTIDSYMQARVMRRLAPYRRAACVVMDAGNGDVIASVSTPGYNPGKLMQGVTNRQWSRFRRARDNPMINRAIQGLYPPGSTFKMVTALAALEAGVVSPSEVISCHGAVSIGSYRYRCWNRGGHGPCDLHRGLRESCDVYFYQLARRVGIRRISEMGGKLGLGQTFADGLALQREGVLPDPDWKRARFGKGWYAGETLLAGIGQGYVLTSPLQLAVMTARIASGRALEPTFAHVVGERRQITHKRLDIRHHYLDRVRRAMHGVVSEPAGTGRRARLGSGRYALAGKTGTSQVTRLSSIYGSDALRWDLRDHALFVGYVEDRWRRAAKFALAVIIEHGGSGGKAAAPLARDIAMDVLGVAGSDFDVSADG